MSESLLMIFVKNPVLGKVKTRLAATVGPERALEIYLKLLEYTNKITLDLSVDKAVFYSDEIEQGDLWDGNAYQKQLQSQGDLGYRLKSAFEWGFQAGYGKICVIGSDCYELTPDIIMESFRELKTYDAVLGPSRDGGYYLLGLKALQPEYFQDKSWGTDAVAAATLKDFQSLGINYSLLRPLTDVDVEQDLGSFEF
jgi:rSAM/selenodomain-associated transferase 1